MSGLISSGSRMEAVSEDVVPSCAIVGAIVFPRVIPCSSVSLDPRGDGGSGLVGLGALSSVKGL